AAFTQPAGFTFLLYGRCRTHRLSIASTSSATWSCTLQLCILDDLRPRVKVFRQFLSRLGSLPWSRQIARTRVVAVRSYSEGPHGRKIRIDKTSGTYIGVTLGALLGGYYVTHLESAPETGRRRFMAVTKEQEEWVGKQALEETLQEFRGRILPFDHPLTQHVRRITRRIIASSNLGHLEGEAPDPEQLIDVWSTSDTVEIPRPPTMRPQTEWVVLVIHDQRLVNAFAAPGLVCVSTGIMPVARNEEGLAAIIGHEIGHVTMRHTAERLSLGKIFLPITGLLLMLGIDPFLSSMLTNYLYSLPHSRALETEADIIGLKLMSRACYDPGAAPRLVSLFFLPGIMYMRAQHAAECSKISTSSRKRACPSSSARIRRRRSASR
ncbi:peptidase family M48-domain-containing protein, partial [Mycena galericulata]